MVALQQRIATRNFGETDPHDLLQYVANGGYTALNRALTEMTPEEINKIEDLNRRCDINLSAEELQDIKDAKPFPAWKFLPWIIEYLGYRLE